MKFVQSLTVNWIIPITLAVGAWCYCTGRVGGWTITLILLTTCKVTTTHKFKG